MPKKFYDIFPPGMKEVSEKSHRPQKLLKNNFNNKINYKVFGVVILLIVIFVLGIIVRSAHLVIQIVPENISVNYEGKIKGEADFLPSDLENNIIPLISDTTDEYQKKMSFPATGKSTEESYAEGTIRVYNNYSTSPQIFVANTRFVSAEGKLFRSIEQVTIPGGKYEEGNFVPGFLDIQIRAAEAGEEYNIEKQSKFSIPGLQGTPQYTSFFGENLKPIRGGSVGEMPKITQSDIESARKILVDSVKKEMIAIFNSNYSSDFILDEKMILNTIIDEEILSEPDKNSENFEYQIKVATKIISFKENDLNSIVQKEMEVLAQETEPFSGVERLNIFDDSYALDYEIISVDFDDENIFLKINSSAIFYIASKEENLKKEISSKKISEVEVILGSYQEILNFNMNFYPSWIKRIPKASKIKIEYEMP